MNRADLALIIDDQRNILTSLSRALSLEDFDVLVAANATEAQSILTEQRPDVIMLDVKMPGMDGLTLLKLLKNDSETQDIPVIMMSGHGTLETAIEAIKAGAYDFIEKPLSIEKILITLHNAVKLSRLSSENRSLKRRSSGRYTLRGRSPQMRELLERIRLCAPTKSRVLITGENGTGKELVARAIHLQSKRSQRPFVKLNCAALPRELIESELFGHEKGAFTGAHRAKKGKFELAHTGTLFLDEIGDMAVDVQAKLLRVLQEGEVERVGGSHEIKVDVRILAATNKDLAHEIEDGRFREDLFYRLNVIPFEVPPLRRRKADIPMLATYFVDEACRENEQPSKRLTEEATQMLLGHEYPGNIRELKNTCERLVILSTGTAIGADDVRRLMTGTSRKSATRGFSYEPGLSLRGMVEVAEREIVIAALLANNLHVTNTAKALAIERSHLYKKAKALGIDLKNP